MDLNYNEGKINSIRMSVINRHSLFEVDYYKTRNAIMQLFCNGFYFEKDSAGLFIKLKRTIKGLRYSKDGCTEHLIFSYYIDSNCMTIKFKGVK